MLYAYTSICLHMLLTVVGGGDCMEGGTTTGKGRHATQVELRLAFDTSNTFLTHFLRPQASGLSDRSADHDKSRAASTKDDIGSTSMTTMQPLPVSNKSQTFNQSEILDPDVNPSDGVPFGGLDEIPNTRR